MTGGADMNKTISLRLTSERGNLLKQAKQFFKVRKNSDAIDLALKMSLRERPDYDERLKAVTGCIQLNGGKTAVDAVRNLRGGL